MKVLYDTKTLEHWISDTKGDNLYWHHDQWMSLEQLQGLGVDEATEYEFEDYEYSTVYKEVEYLNMNRWDAMNNYNVCLTEEFDPDDDDFEDEDDFYGYQCRWLKTYSVEIATFDAEYNELYEQIEARIS